MADAKIVNIKGVQWDLKDEVARNEIVKLKEDNTISKTDIQNLKKDKLNIIAEEINVDLNTLDNSAFAYGTVKYFNVIKGSLHEPPFPTMSEPISFYNMKVSKSYRSVTQEIESVYPNVNGNWSYIKFRRAQVDGLWFSWKTIESYVM